MRIIHLIFAVILTTTFVWAQNKKNESGSYITMSWKNVATKMPSEWYGSDEAKMVADSVLKYQTRIGGWPKNSRFHSGNVKQDEMARIKLSGVGATFDNGATITELRFLAKVYSHFKDDRYKNAFKKGLDYIFISQYGNGGWPQFFPVREGNAAYSAHITYNDDAMVNIMVFLKKKFGEQCVCFIANNQRHKSKSSKIL